MKSLCINNLFSGGIITNYHCTSKCRHCLYACSPTRSKEFIEPGMVIQHIRKIKELGCYSVHIGGGEPFLNQEGLLKTLESIASEGIGVDYVETNSSWFRDHDQAVELLKEMKKFKLHTLLVSISPFHNEYIPFGKTKGLIEACRYAGIKVFPWVQDFFQDLNAFDDSKTHSLSQYSQRFGNSYLKNIPSRYWIHYGGRALYAFKDNFRGRKASEIMKFSSGCTELADSSHFHADPKGNYIPGLCSGLSIRMNDLGKPLDANFYPLLTVLFNDGVKGLYQYVVNNYNFSTTAKYVSKCHLCLEIRKFLVIEKHISSQELQPLDFYHHV